MAFEYNGKVYLNLEEQVEVNSRMAVDAKEAADTATEAVANKMDKVPSTFTGGIPTINMDGSLTNSNRRFVTEYGTARQEGQVVYSHALIPTEKATVDFLNDNYTKSADITAALEGKVDKVTGNNRVYANNANGEPASLEYAAAATPSTIPYRTVAGNIYAAAPTANGHAATKGYVDTGLAKKVAKQTTTSTAKRAYAYDNTGDINVVISADNANSDTLVQRTSAGRIVCNDPNAAGQAATKNYVDTNFAPKAENGYVEKRITTGTNWRLYAYNNDGDYQLITMGGGDGSAKPTTTGNVLTTTDGKIRVGTPTGPYHAANKKYVDDLVASAVVDFNGSNLDAVTTTVGLKVYAAMQTFGFFVPKHTGDGTIFARPLTDSEITIPTGSFAFSIVQATSSGMKDSYINNSGLYFTVDSSGNITMEV